MVSAVSPCLKKRLQQRRAFAFIDAAIDLRPVMAGGCGKEANAVVHRPALGIGGAEIKPPDTGKRHRRRAHGAGLERHIEIAICEALGAECSRRLPDRQQFGVRGRVAVGQRAVAGAGDDFTVAHDDAADRHLTARGCSAGFVEGDGHEGRRRHFCSVMPGTRVRPKAGPSINLVPGIHALYTVRT